MKTTFISVILFLLLHSTSCSFSSRNKPKTIKAYGKEIKISISKDSIQTSYTIYGEASFEESLNNKTIFIKDSVLMPDSTIIRGPYTLHLKK
ncbi:hypothetical protein [Carboxylicivirga linearis]|uniref:Auto-transporter adhesin head GIN domain-containing protein n=1 Tax=Carboxylicivirga linearis TaxID=1628157 RepID=A0ABS5JRM1_9BACT|nr:hypothetical protein [Carboxylicivirga linearis]MBS2097452.1 hypothetical protein [Carboxylicivirga linearis]